MSLGLRLFTNILTLQVIRTVVNMHFESQTYVRFPLKLVNNYTPNFSNFIYTVLLFLFVKIITTTPKP